MRTLETALVEGDPFDLVILDQDMPGQSGVDLVRKIRRVPGIRATKLVLATSMGLPNPSDEASKVGFDDILEKPIKRSILLGSLARVLTKAPAEAKPRSLDILVAEDNEINQMLVETLLADMGHHVTVVNDGAAVVEAASSRDYDLILMDIQMPGMSGIEATRQIRHLQQGTAQTPIIALTAHALVSEREEILAAGMQDHLAKPISVADLAEVIERWSGGTETS